MNTEQLIRMHEGERRLAYDDANGQTLTPGTWLLGNATIGVGRNLVGKGLSTDEMDYLLHNDIAEIQSFLSNYPWYSKLDPVRQAALTDLAFNTGRHGFSGYARMIAVLSTGDYGAVAGELLKSKGAEQLPKRYGCLADMLKTGQWPTDAP
jgi:lysozyme